MKFLADMGIANRIVQWLRDKGHNAVHLREENLHRLPNGLIFEKAHTEKRILLTFDLDFGEIVGLSGEKKVPVILFRLRNTRTSHIIERLDKVLQDSSETLDEGVIIVVEETRHRIRRYPFSG